MHLALARTRGQSEDEEASVLARGVADAAWTCPTQGMLRAPAGSQELPRGSQLPLPSPAADPLLRRCARRSHQLTRIYLRVQIGFGGAGGQTSPWLILTQRRLIGAGFGLAATEEAFSVVPARRHPGCHPCGASLPAAGVACLLLPSPFFPS